MEADKEARNSADVSVAPAVAEPVPVPPPPAMVRAAVVVGSAGLAAATVTDALAVLGRHTGVALLGSIELVQVAVLALAASSIVLATLEERHAAVHILTERLSPARARVLGRGAAAAGALFFALLAFGSAWLAADLWAGHERSELLHLPFRILRLFLTAALAAVALLFARTATRR